MSKLKLRTVPDMSISSTSHQEALSLGKEHFHAINQNVIDELKGKSTDEIQDFLKKKSHPFAICFEHWIGDFNMGTGVRNANAFGAREVFYLGDKKWDRRSAVGVHNYTPVQWVSTFDELIKLKEKYVFVGVDNVPGSVSISGYNWPDNVLMVFGEEGVGLTPDMQAICKDIVHIDMFGSVRSLNCGTASGIAMFDFVSKLKKD